VTTNHAVRVRGLTKSYGSHAVLNGIDLFVARGECVGILGPNGAGKTTTLEIIQGLTEPNAGEVEVLGLSQPRDRVAIQARIGVALQDTRLHEKLTARETLELFRSFYESGPELIALLEKVDLRAAANTLVGGLSGGQRQRLAIACALAGNPDLIILDEPTTGLDPEARQRIWELVASLGRQGRAVLLTTHFMEEAERLCSRILVVDHGRVIAEGAPATLIREHLGTHVVEVEPALHIEQGSGPLHVEQSKIAQLDGVHVAFASGRVIRLGTSSPDAVLESARRLAQSHHIEFDRVIVRHATLEDVFLVLTGRSLADDS
jgi:ABC-2 type transport system ATP-binding protein